MNFMNNTFYNSIISKILTFILFLGEKYRLKSIYKLWIFLFISPPPPLIPRAKRYGEIRIKWTLPYVCRFFLLNLAPNIYKTFIMLTNNKQHSDFWDDYIQVTMRNRIEGLTNIYEINYFSATVCFLTFNIHDQWDW